MASEVRETAVAEEPKAERVSFFTLDLRRIGRGRLIRALAIGLCIISISILPAWRLLWYFPLYGYMDFLPTRDVHGRYRAAWHWIDGKEIRIYAAPGVARGSVQEIAEGVQAMVDEANLDFAVKVLPLPPAVEEAYQESLSKHTQHGVSETRISFNQLASRLITLRDGDPHADILVVNAPMTECWWAFGMASFTCGVGVLQENNASFHLGKHETCHLLGYHYHDSLPLVVLGYREHPLPWKRETLMMLYGKGDDLSPRARDALHYFWRGMEKRSGKQFLK